MWPGFESVLSVETPMKDILTFLNLIPHVNKLSLEDSEVESWNSKIDELISSPLTRFEGYLFVDAVLANNPTVYINRWGPYITASLKCSDNYVSKQLTFRILRRVVLNFSADPIYSEAFHRFIPEILSLLLETEQNDQVAFVNCCKALATCMHHLPSILGQHDEEIRTFLFKNLDTAIPDIVDGVAECFAALPICIGSYQKPKIPIGEVWCTVYLETLNTIQSLINDMFELCEVGDSFVNVDGLNLLKIEFEPMGIEFSYSLTRIRIFSSLCRCLSKLMNVGSRFSSESMQIKVPVHDTLQCMERIFNFKRINKVKQLQKCSIFILAYSSMQNAVLDVVEALIANFPIIEQSGNFVKLLKGLMDAPTLTNFLEPSISRIRSAAWKALNIWLKQYGAKGSFEIVNDRVLIQELLRDVAIDPENMPPPTGVNVAGNKEESCFQALQALQNIFAAGGSYMEKDLVDEISITILKTIRKIQLHLHPAKTFPYPYTNENCRLKLYASLLSGSLFGDPMQTKYINQTVNVFKIAMKDPNFEINTMCHKAFKLCRIFLNPKKLPPECLTCLEMANAHPPPPLEEIVQTGWESGNWNISNESSQEEKSMDIPCHIETVYHNAVENDGQRDLSVPNTKSPIHYSEAHESQSQCNGNNSRLVSNKPPSHSNVCNDSESDEIEEYKEYSLEEPHLMSVDIPPITPVPIISSVESAVTSEPKIANPEPKIIELKPLDPVVPGDVATKTNHRDSSAADDPVKCVEDVEEEEVLPNRPLKRMAENGMDLESEDEESNDEEDEEASGTDEDEEVNEAYMPDERYSPEFYQHEPEVNSDRCSPEYFHERPVKRRKVSNEEDRSSEDYEEEKSSNQNQEMMNQDEESEDDEEVRQSEGEGDGEEEEEMPNGSPTVSEMCRDFVLAEPEEIS